MVAVLCLGSEKKQLEVVIRDLSRIQKCQKEDTKELSIHVNHTRTFPLCHVPQNHIDETPSPLVKWSVTLLLKEKRIKLNFQSDLK